MFVVHTFLLLAIAQLSGLVGVWLGSGRTSWQTRLSGSLVACAVIAATCRLYFIDAVSTLDITFHATVQLYSVACCVSMWLRVAEHDSY